jgi:hypothetical protein
MAPEMGIGEILAQSVSYADHPYEAGYLRCGPWWWLDTTWLADRSKLPASS